MKRRTTLSWLFYVLLPLLLGFAIYILYRQDTWLHHTLFPNSVQRLQKPGGIAGDMLVYNLPDFLWCFSLAASLILLKQWLDIRNRYYYAGVLLLLLASEFVQLIFPGHFTFDSWDIGAAVLAFSLSVLWLKPQNEKV